MLTDPARPKLACGPTATRPAGTNHARPTKRARSWGTATRTASPSPSCCASDPSLPLEARLPDERPRLSAGLGTPRPRSVIVPLVEALSAHQHPRRIRDGAQLVHAVVTDRQAHPAVVGP